LQTDKHFIEISGLIQTVNLKGLQATLHLIKVCKLHTRSTSFKVCYDRRKFYRITLSRTAINIQGYL